jgi:hypothetical protein
MVRILAALALVIPGPFPRQESAPIPAEKFDLLRRLIQPYPGEFAWRDEIPWLTAIQEAREKAAAEGKPILFWCAADGHPLTQP